MAFNDQQFEIELYDEHQFESGMLLTSLQPYYFDDEISWLETHELTLRLDAHVDAMELGGNTAYKISVDALEGGDEEELIGAVYILGTILPDSVQHLVILANAIMEAGDDAIECYIFSFKYAKHPKLSIKLLPLLQHDKPVIRAAIAEILGYRGDTDPHRIWPLFHGQDESVKTAAMVAVMRLGFKEAVPAMEQAVLENKDMFNEHRVFPLLMLGSKKALEFSRRACQSADYIKPQYPIYLALGGKEQDIVHILKALEFENMNLAVLEALGIFGSLKGVNTLMKFLSSPEAEEKLAAAKSLNQISGAQLVETLTDIEKEEEEADIDPEDITGKPAASGEEKQPGDELTIEIKQDCTDKVRWMQWWQENKTRFDSSIRYRHGKCYSFLFCLEEIAHPQTKFDDRQRAYHELVMRSGHHIPFEPDWFVDKQIEALKKWQVWWNENKSSLTNQWMFDGR